MSPALEVAFSTSVNPDVLCQTEFFQCHCAMFRSALAISCSFNSREIILDLHKFLSCYVLDYPGFQKATGAQVIRENSHLSVATLTAFIKII